MQAKGAERAWGALDPLLFGGALVVYAAGLPLGLDRPGSAPVVAEGAALELERAGGAAPLALLAIRLAACVPLGDLATRAGVASALAGALAVALLGRLCCEALALLRSRAPGTRPGAGALSAAGAGPAPVSLADPLAAGGAAALAGLSLAPFVAATAPGAAALSLALVAACWLCVVRLLRAPDDPHLGAGLALLAGLAAGVEPSAVPLAWGPGFATWIWALRKGRRWPLVAPLLFVAGLGVSLAAVAVARAPAALGELVGGLWPTPLLVGGAAARAAALETGEQLGVIGLLLAAAGLIVVAVRAPALLALALGGLVGGTFLAGATAAPIAAAAAALPIAVGIAHLAGRLGRARIPAAASLASMALVSPVLDGGASRWVRTTSLPSALLTRALAGVPPRGSVDPGTPEMKALFRYARAVGLRPDVRIESADR